MLVSEPIPDEDDVSRHLFAPFMGAHGADLIWDVVFMFKTDKKFRESVVWRKYAATLVEVHALGCNKQRADRTAGKNITYFGALTSNVGRIRKIRSKRGARFQVTHVPDEGIQHAEISYLHDSPLTKNDKAELKTGIRKEFSERSEHTCPEE
jgi:hypothetical protein